MSLFPDLLYLSAFLGGLICSAGSLPFWRTWCLRTGLLDAPGERKIHFEPIPLAGGFAVFTGLFLPATLGAAVATLGLWPEAGGLDKLQYGLERRGPQLAIVLLGGAAMAALGWLDDRRALRAAPKLAGQTAVALAVALCGLRISLFVPSLLFSVLATALWIVVATNAVNIMDNMNGLCGGVGAIAAFYFGLNAAIQGQYLAASLAWLACGALVGFLPFNFPKAKVFLGDTGSHLVGYLLAVMAILPDFYSPDRPVRWAVLTPLFILAVPLGDMLRVIYVRRRLGKPIYLADTNHISHRLVAAGLSPVTAVLLLWLATAALGAIPFFCF